MAFRIVKTPRFDDYERVAPARFRSDFTGKSVLITGGGRGIGPEIARSFAAAGVAELRLFGRTEKTLTATRDALKADFPDVKVELHVGDVCIPADVQRLFQEIGAKSPDVLVSNAGVLPPISTFVDADLTGAWWTTFQVNFLGAALVLQSYLRHRRAAAPKPAAPGIVVTMNTGLALYWPVPTNSSYAPSKAALARLSEIVSAEVDPSEARLITVQPGSVKTDMYYQSATPDLVPPTDIKLAANFVVWAASEEASFLAGRFAWVNWDVDELVSRKEDILKLDLLKTDLKEESVTRGIMPGEL